MLCRYIYNAAVDERRETWRLRGVNVTYFQGSMRREAGYSCAACVHEPEQIWLWRAGPEGLVHPLAFVPGVRYGPASGPQRGEEWRRIWRGLGKAFREAWRWSRRRT